MAALEGNQPHVGGPQSTGANYQIVETTKGEYKLFINGEPHTLKVGGKEVTNKNQLERLVSVFEKTIGNVPVLKEGQVLKLSAKTGIQIKDTNTKTVTQLKFKDATAETKFASRLDKLVLGTAMNTKGLSIEKSHTTGANTTKDNAKPTHTESGRPHGTNKAEKIFLEMKEPEPVAQHEEVIVPQGEQRRSPPDIPSSAPPAEDMEVPQEAPKQETVKQEVKTQDTAVSGLAFMQHLAEDIAKKETIPADTAPPPPPYDTDDTSTIETPQDEAPPPPPPDDTVDESSIETPQDEAPPPPPPPDDIEDTAPTPPSIDADAPPPPPPDEDYSEHVVLSSKDETHSKSLEHEAAPAPPERDETEISADVAPEALDEPEEGTETADDIVRALKNFYNKTEETEVQTEAPAPPTPPPPPTAEKAPVGGPRSALLDEITKGTTLKKVETTDKKVVLTEEEQLRANRRAAIEGNDDEETEDIDEDAVASSPSPNKEPEIAKTPESLAKTKVAPEPPPPPPPVEKATVGSPRSALLDAIQQGKPLRKVEENPKKDVEEKSEGTSGKNIFEAGLANMRPVAQPQPEPEPEGDDDEWK